MMFWSDHDMSGWGYTGMVIGMVLFWALIIVGIIALIRYTAGAPQSRAVPQLQQHYSDYDSPEQMLAELHQYTRRGARLVVGRMADVERRGGDGNGAASGVDARIQPYIIAAVQRDVAPARAQADS